MKEALEIFRLQGDRLAEGIAFMNIARIHFNFNRLPKAEVAAKRAQVLFAEEASVKNEADALYLLSHIYLASGEYEQSLRAGKQSRGLWRDVFDDQAEFNQMLLMGQAALFLAISTGIPLMGEKPKPEWQKAFDIIEEAKVKAMGMDANVRENMLQACYMMGQAHYGTREYAKAARSHLYFCRISLNWLVTL